MKIGTTPKSQDLETQILNVEPSKTKNIISVISLLSLICLVLFGWSLYLTLDLANVKQNLIESDHQLHDLNRTATSEYDKESTETASKKYFIEPQRAKRDLNDQVTAIHIEAVRPPNAPRRGGVTVAYGKLCSWRISNLHLSQHFVTTHLNTRGYITVPEDGIYFIYSQVVFTKTPTNHISAEIGVGRRGAETFEKCLITQESNARKYSTCHSSGTKFLRKGDGISISVTPGRAQVYLEPKFTYFGAVLLGSV